MKWGVVGGSVVITEAKNVFRAEALSISVSRVMPSTSRQSTDELLLVKVQA